MNKKNIFLALFVLLIFLLVVRIILYNRYLTELESNTRNMGDTTGDTINNTSNTHLNIKESFDNKNNNIYKKISDVNNNNISTESNSKGSSLSIINSVLNNPKIIYTSIMGETFYISGKDCVIDNSEKKKLLSVKDIFNIDISVEGGYFNHLLGTINMFSDNKIYVYNLKSSKVSLVKSISNFYNIDSNININTVMVYFNKLLLFCDKYKFIVKDDEKTSIDNIDSYFPNLPRNISCAFINFLDIDKGIPIGTPTFVKNKDYYIYDIKNKLVKGPRKLDNGFITNVKIYKLVETKLNFTLNNSGMYRVYMAGGGLPSGGYGAFIFNDIYIKKNHKLDIICGKSGTRLPVKSQTSNKLTGVYSIQFPYNSSCSGSGGSFLFINKTLEMVSGGGGGWSNEIVEAPQFCNSKPIEYNYSSNDEKKKINEPKFILPLKKILILTEKGSSDTRYKINITKLNINVYNLDTLDVNIEENPKQYSKKYKYETGYCNKDQQASIDIIFNSPISSFSIELDYEIISSGNDKFINSKVIFIDEQYRKHYIDNFNYVFNYKYITGTTLLMFLKKVKNIKYNNIKSADGNKTHSLNELLESYKLSPTQNTYDHIKLRGGQGGGGSVTADKHSKEIIVGGGGGYAGGLGNKTNNNTFDYVGGSGGSSFIKNLYYNEEFDIDYIFKNEFNSKDGYVIFHLIEKRIDLNPVQKEDNSKNNNTEKINESSNTYKFFNHNVEMFFDNPKLNKIPSISSKIENDKRDFYPINNQIVVNDNIFIIPIDLKIKRNNKSNNKYCDVYYVIESSIAFDVIQIGWKSNSYKRTLIGNTNNSILSDDISTFNHNHSRLNKTKMEKYLMFLLKNNIYSHSNDVSYTDLKRNIDKYHLSTYKLFDLDSFRILSKKTNNSKLNFNNNNVNNNINRIKAKIISDDNLYNKIFLVLKFDNSKIKKRVKYSIIQHNSIELSSKEIENAIFSFHN